MRPIQTFLNLSFLSSGVLASSPCTASQKCWPSSSAWSSFNSSVNGRLVAPRPPAWPCHDPNYDELACADAKTNWFSSFWRANQTGAMQDLVWESPDCDISSPRNVTCKQGFVPAYAVVAHEANDVSKAVNFAGKYDLRLVVKNTGHDYLGRSSGAGSLSIWTHQLKGRKFTDSFVAKGCESSTSGVPAVTLGAAEQWLDVYQAANERNVTVVGGAARSVGAAGGWVQGGGHSPLGALYGMGVDNTLQFTLVKPNGKIVTANACQNKDLFWALRGGGGSTWGVTLDVTYRTHPALEDIVGLGFTLNTTSPENLIEFSETFLRAIPNITDEGVRGYGFWMPPLTFSIIFIHPNSPSVESTNKTLEPLWDWISSNEGTQARTIGARFPTFFDFFTTWITDVSIGVTTWLGTRLVSRDALISKSDELAQYIFGDRQHFVGSINIVGGGAVSKVNPESTGLNPQWRNDALISWNFGSSWADDASSDEIETIKKSTTKTVQEFGKIAGLEHAAYFNEADPREPQWKKSFFGSHYDRLLSIKRKVDPQGLFTCNRCVGSDL
ncbi:FAD binding domain-containing protein [Ceratobasidium sp. AG-I]|nr:FAD binding domain-containing protein [Ceratobasidium sp. AG-I]